MKTELLNNVADYKLHLLIATIGTVSTSLLAYISENRLWFVLSVWLLIMIATIWEHATRLVKNEKTRFQRTLKLGTYTLVCVVCKVISMWIIADIEGFLEIPTTAVVIFIFYAMASSEIKSVGNNFLDRYGEKPEIFNKLDRLDVFINRRYAKFEKKAYYTEKQKAEMQEND